MPLYLNKKWHKYQMLVELVLNFVYIVRVVTHRKLRCCTAFSWFLFISTSACSCRLIICVSFTSSSLLSSICSLIWWCFQATWRGKITTIDYLYFSRQSVSLSVPLWWRAVNKGNLAPVWIKAVDERLTDFFFFKLTQKQSTALTQPCPSEL